VDAVRVPVRERDGEREFVAVALVVGENDADAVIDGLTLCVAVCDGVNVGLVDGELPGDGVRVCVRVALAVSDAVRDGVPLRDAERDGVPETEGVRERDGVADGVADSGVSEAVIVPEAEGVAVGERVPPASRAARSRMSARRMLRGARDECSRGGDRRPAAEGARSTRARRQAAAMRKPSARCRIFTWRCAPLLDAPCAGRGQVFLEQMHVRRRRAAESPPPMIRRRQRSSLSH
jgi:hypothetical protein